MERRTLEIDRLRPWLDAVAEISKLVNAVSHDGLLDLIARRTAQLTRQDFCAVQMLDATAQQLTIAGNYGLREQYVRTVNTANPIGLTPGSDFYNSPSSRAFRTRRPVVIQDVERSASFGPWQRLARAQGYRSIVAVPMSANGNVVGVLACYSRRPEALAKGELAGVELMAEQAALAIQTAELRRREAHAMAELEQKNHLLVQHQQMLERAEFAHRQLMHLVLAGRDLQAIAQELGDALRAPVAVEDATHRSIIRADYEGRHVELPSDTAEGLPGPHLDSSLENRAVLYRPLDPNDAHAPDVLYVCPIIVGGELVGRLWIQPRHAHLDPADRRTAEGAALVIAMEMLKRRAALEVELRLSRDLLTDLLLGTGLHNPQDLINVARQIGHDLIGPHQLLIAGYSQASGVEPKALARHMVSAALQATDGIKPKPVIGLRQDVGILLLPLTSNSTRSAHQIAARWHQALLRYAEATVISGDIVSEIADYPQAFAVACGALRLVTRGSEPGGVLDLSQFGLFTVLLRSSDPQPLRDFARTKLSPVHAYDRRRGTDLLATLQAYLRHGGRTADVARALTVHPNTVLNRVARLEDLLDMDLADPQGRLEVQLAIMIDAIGHVNEPLHTDVQGRS